MGGAISYERGTPVAPFLIRLWGLGFSPIAQLSLVGLLILNADP